MAIIGMHALMYSKKADETRAFLRDLPIGRAMTIVQVANTLRIPLIYCSCD